MSDPDIRWKQRFDNFKKALAQLNEAEELSRQRPLSPLENQGLVQAFEFTFELAWNTLRDFLMSKGVQGLIGSKDTAREAFKVQLITDDEGWTMMLNDRNRSSHTYNQATAEEIVAHIHSRYVSLFRQLSTKLRRSSVGRMMAKAGEDFGLTASVIAMIRKVFSHYPPVTEVRVYGSRAKGNYRAGSDIDLSIMDESYRVRI